MLNRDCIRQRISKTLYDVISTQSRNHQKYVSATQETIGGSQQSRVWKTPHLFIVHFKDKKMKQLAASGVDISPYDDDSTATAVNCHSEHRPSRRNEYGRDYGAANWCP